METGLQWSEPSTQSPCAILSSQRNNSELVRHGNQCRLVLWFSTSLLTMIAIGQPPSRGNAQLSPVSVKGSCRKWISLYYLYPGGSDQKRGIKLHPQLFASQTSYKMDMLLNQENQNVG